jgi:hypothetical protein
VVQHGFSCYAEGAFQDKKEGCAVFLQPEVWLLYTAGKTTAVAAERDVSATFRQSGLASQRVVCQPSSSSAGSQNARAQIFQFAIMCFFKIGLLCSIACDWSSDAWRYTVIVKVGASVLFQISTVQYVVRDVGHKLWHALNSHACQLIRLLCLVRFACIVQRLVCCKRHRCFGAKFSSNWHTVLTVQYTILYTVLYSTPGLPPHVDHEITEAFLKSATILAHCRAHAEQSMGAATSILFPCSRK